MKVSDELETKSNNHARTPVEGVSGPASTSKVADADPEGAEERTDDSVIASEATGGWMAVLIEFFQSVSGSAGSLIEVYADRARISVRRKIVQAVVVVCVVVCTLVWLSAAALATFRGVCGGLTELWGGRAWLGDLSGGLLALVLATVAIASYVRLSSRRELRKLKAKYERIRNERNEAQTSAVSTGNGGGPAGPRGSAGDPGHHGLGGAHG